MQQTIAVVGLEYVGLSLAGALVKYFLVIGFDINPTRIEELKKGVDRTNEVESKEFLNPNLVFTIEIFSVMSNEK